MAGTCKDLEKSKNINQLLHSQKFDHKRQIKKSRHLVRTILSNKNQRINLSSPIKNL